MCSNPVSTCIKKSTCILLLALLFISLKSFGQNLFQRTYGNSLDDYATSIRTTSDQGYIMTGSTWIGQGLERIWLIKLNASGDTVWTRYFSGPNSAGGTEEVLQTSDGGFLVASGGSYMLGNTNVYLVKFDSTGTLVWSRSIGGPGKDYIKSVAELDDGGFIMAGYTESFGAGNGDLLLIKTDESGNPVWMETFGGTGYEIGLCIRKTSDLGFIIAGRTASYGAGNQDILLIKTDSSGALAWAKTYGGPDNDYGYTVLETPSGFLLAGVSLGFGAGAGDVVAIRTDFSGNIIQSKTLGGDAADGASYMVATSDGNYLISGNTNSFGDGSSDCYLLKINDTLDLLWSSSYGGSDFDYASTVAETEDDGIIIAGQTKSYGTGGADIFVIKTNAGGFSGCSNQIAPATVESSPAMITGSPLLQISTPTLATSPLNTTASSGLTVSDPCIVTSSGDGPESTTINIFPNPCQRDISILLSNTLKSATINLFNTLGKSVFELKEVSGKEYNLLLPSLPNGIYRVVITENHVIVAESNLSVLK